MKPKWLRLAPVLSLAVALGFAACADQAADPLAPKGAAYGKGGVKGSENAKGPQVKGGKKGGTTEEVTLAVGMLPDIKDTKDEALIGSAGGCVETSGHFLCVPAGVMKVPATFKIMQFKKKLADGTVVVAVDAKASRVVDGDTVVVGALPEGFGKDANGNPNKVDLYLTPDWSTNRPKNKDGSLAALSTQNTTVLYFPTGSLDGVKPAEILPISGFGSRKDRGGKAWSVVHVQLEHFSEYGIGWPNWCRDLICY